MDHYLYSENTRNGPPPQDRSAQSTPINVYRSNGHQNELPKRPPMFITV